MDLDKPQKSENFHFTWCGYIGFRVRCYVKKSLCRLTPPSVRTYLSGNLSKYILQFYSKKWVYVLTYQEKLSKYIPQFYSKKCYALILSSYVKVEQSYQSFSFFSRGEKWWSTIQHENWPRRKISMKMCTRVQLSQDFLLYLVCFTIGMVLYSDSYGTSMFYKQHKKITKIKDDLIKKDKSICIWKQQN